MIDGYNDAVRNALVTAFEEARHSKHEEIHPEHIFLGLLAENNSSAIEFIAGHGLTITQIRELVQSSLPASTNSPTLPKFSADAAEALAQGQRTAATEPRKGGADDLLVALLAHLPAVTAALQLPAERLPDNAPAAALLSDSSADGLKPTTKTDLHPMFDYAHSVTALSALQLRIAAIADTTMAGEPTDMDEINRVLTTAYNELETVTFGIRNVLHTLPMALDDWVDHAHRRPEFVVMKPAMLLIEELFRLNTVYSIDQMLTAAGHTFSLCLRITREMHPPAKPGSAADLATLEPLASRLPDWIRACIRVRRLATVVIGIDDLTSVASTVNPSWWQEPDEHTFRQALDQAQSLLADGNKNLLGRWHFERYHRNLSRKRVALARKHGREIAFICAQATCSVPQLAADLAQRDIVYLGASVAGDGVALRMNGSTKETDGLVLSGFGREEVAAMKRLEASARAARAANQLSYSEYSAALWSLILQVGERVVEPLVRRWPDMHRATLIPIGHAYGLPYGVVPLAVEDYRQRGLDLTVCPSARTMLISALSTRASSITPRAYIVADCDKGRNRIPRAGDEVDQVAAMWDVAPTVFNQPRSPSSGSGGEFRQPHTSPNSRAACPSSVLDGIVGADIVHISCHGSLRDDPPRAELWIGGLLDTTQLLERGMQPGATVILSACSVGNINARYSTEVLGFPTTILGSGAREVIASLWPVPDSVQTVQLMLSIHRLLRSGHSPNESFRQAISDAADGGESPAIWGGYSMFGV
ncbi:CHAT domain-containing protein [Mycolicibacterium cosmeticum]|uniref:CHAT domain-containing protein n=1 Tax=Mycolicibacterium cosmeticum TaxID=258533 RepID=UPI0032048741